MLVNFAKAGVALEDPVTRAYMANEEYDEVRGNESVAGKQRARYNELVDHLGENTDSYNYVPLPEHNERAKIERGKRELAQQQADAYYAQENLAAFTAREAGRVKALGYSEPELAGMGLGQEQVAAEYAKLHGMKPPSND